MRAKHSIIVAAALLAAVFTTVGRAQTVIQDDFTQAASTNNWYFFNGACMTAGSGTSTASPGPIPGCSSVFSLYYTGTEHASNSAGANWYDQALVGGQNGVAPPQSGCAAPLSNPSTQCSATTTTLPDSVGSGALRFTNGFPYGYFERGAIISASSFNTGQGVQVTFKTVTYRGDQGGEGADGADGIGFFLIDASKGNPANGVGAVGGSVGYSCSNENSPADGLVGGYLGLGIDEYGNFLNGAALMSGYTGTNPSATYTMQHGDNSALGYGYYPNRVGLRGAGSVSWSYLHSTYGTYYPSSLSSTQQVYAVQWTCVLGQVLNFSSSAPSNPNSTGAAVPAAVSPQPSPALLDYNPIPNAYVTLPVQIAAETAWSRTAATPIQYNLKITQNGLLSLAYSLNGGAYQPVISGQSIAASNGSLPASLYFGFSGSTGGSTNIHEILCFKAAPPEQSSSSASVNEKQTTEVLATSQAFFSFYDPNDWTGRVVALPLVDTAGVITVGSATNGYLANWDSECTVSGIPSGQTCSWTGVSGTVAAEAPTSRVMLTWNGLDTTATPGTAGTPFEWPSTGVSGITTTEENTIDAGDTAPLNANRLNYLRGVRSNEINSAGVGLFRARDGVIGDIVDSSPVFVGPPTSPYQITWKDRLQSTDTMLENSGTQTYKAFKVAELGRLNVVYVGANDGFLHGFESGTEDASGNVVAGSANDGAEVLAYMPGAVLDAIHNASVPGLDYPNTQYAHNFYVDATPGTGDLFYGGAWHTWLVGGLGAGGAAIYALDITDPVNEPFSEANAGGAGGVVKGEWSPANITCLGNGANSTNCGQSMGNTYGTPQIRRFHNGTWGAVFGNGYGSATGDAGIFVMLINQSTGAATFYYLSTGSGTLASPGSDGIADVTTADLDGDHITDYVYAGDLQGNVWRFDLTSTNPASWTVTSGPLFKTPSGQPITEPVVVASVVAAGAVPQIMVGFGSGHRTQFTNTSAATYASGTQSLYGVWDSNFSAWDAISKAQYMTLSGAPATLHQSNLQAQTLTQASTTTAGVTTTTVTTSNTAVTWATCSGTCTGSFGWYANLPGSLGATNSAGAALTEQIASAPGLYQSALVVNSAIPANNQILSCSSSTTDGGVTYAISMATGGIFNSTGGGTQSAFTAFKNTTTVGVLSNETGALAVVNTTEGTTYLLGQLIQVKAPTGSTAGQVAGLQQVSLPSNVKYTRLTWVELR